MDRDPSYFTDKLDNLTNFTVMTAKTIINYFVIFSFLIFIDNTESVQKQILNAVRNNLNLIEDDDLQKLFEKFFNKVIIIIKQKDPFNYEGFDFNVDSYGITCKGFLKDLSLSSISSVSITNIKVIEKPLHFELGLGFTQLQLLAVYDLDFDFLTMIPLSGKGDIGAAVSNINISVTTDIGNQNEGDIMELTSLNLNLTMQSLKMDIQNLLGNPVLGKFVSQIISDVSPNLLSILGKLVTTEEGRVKALANDYLTKQGITFKQVLEIVKHFVQ